MKRIFILITLCVITLTVFSQNWKISGTVTESVTSLPLAGVTVKIKNKNVATLTDVDGKYSIDVTKEETLIFSFLGMQTVSKEVTTNTPIDVQMLEDNVVLDQVVVIGYGTVKKSHLTGAVSSVSSKELQADIAKDVSSALQGKIPGVSVTSYSGQPGKGLNIRVRGISSLLSNDPLYVIDGVYGDINLIDPNDIASIEVLKDASAAAIYGSRAANGVVLISTKNGRKNTPTKMDLNLYAGIQQISKTLEVMNAPEWIGFLKGRIPAQTLENSKYAKSFTGAGTDWQDEVYRTAPIYKANLNMNGGSETSVYSASIGYLSQDGIMLNSGYDAFTARLKNEFSFLNNKLKIGESLILKSSKSKGEDQHSLVTQTLRMPAIVPVYDSSRSFGWGAVETWMTNLPNPVGDTYVNSSWGTNTSRNTNILFNAYAQAELYKGLAYKLNFGLNQNHYNGQSFRDVYDFSRSGSNQIPDLSESASKSKTWLLEHTLNYDNTFGKHTVSALVGYSAQQAKRESFSAGRLDLPLGTSALHAGKGAQSNSGTRYVSSLVSMFGRVMYSYDSRYMLSMSIRRDGSSRFEDGHRYGNYPSASLGWNIHNESFAAPMKRLVDELKLRVSYGKLGNQELDDYRTKSTVTPGINYVQGSDLWVGAMPGIGWVSPKDLKWEESETTNIGLDASLLNGKLTLTADAFVTEVKDLLMPVAMPGSTGLKGSPWLNAGTAQNKGFELAITHRNTVDKVFYSLTGNISTVSNKVKKVTVGNTQEIGGYSPQGLGTVTWFKEDEPMGVFRVLKTDGIFQSQEEIKAYKNKEGKLIQPNAEPGDVKYIDYNGDGAIDNNDRQTVGKPMPDFSFGLRANVEYKGFDASLFFDGMVGNSIYNFTRYRMESMLELENYGKNVLNAWTKERPSATMPRFIDRVGDGNMSQEEKDKIKNNKNAIVNSDRWIEKGDFFRLKTLEIGYTLPRQILSKIKLDRVRFYGVIDNLFTATGYSGYTPDLGYNKTSSSYEALTRGCDHGRYPQSRTFTFGVQIGL